MMKFGFYGFLILLLMLGCGNKSEINEVLFVCTHGAARSPIASAYFNLEAKKKGLNYRSIFRGTEPDEVLTKETIKGLGNDGFDVSSWKPSEVTKSDMSRASIIVTFDCDLSDVNSEAMSVIQWNGTPAISKDYILARDVIKRHVDKLIMDLSKNIDEH